MTQSRLPHPRSFQDPQLSGRAQSVLTRQKTQAAPSNLITPDITAITPNLLPLINLTQTDITTSSNVLIMLKISTLSPLQAGLLLDLYLVIRQSWRWKNKGTLIADKPTAYTCDQGLQIFVLIKACTPCTPPQTFHPSHACIKRLSPSTSNCFSPVSSSTLTSPIHHTLKPDRASGNHPKSKK